MQNRYFRALLALALSSTGCSSYSVVRSCPDVECVSYVEITEAHASPLSLLSGEALTCKVTEFGQIGDWVVIYKGEHCEAVLNGKGVDF